MRTQEQIRAELVAIGKIDELRLNKEFEGVQIKVSPVNNNEVPKDLEEGSDKIWGGEPDMRFAYLSGRIDGMIEALKWVLSESGDLEYTD